MKLNKYAFSLLAVFLTSSMGCASLKSDLRKEDREAAKLANCVYASITYWQAEQCKEESRQRCLNQDMEPDCAIDGTGKYNINPVRLWSTNDRTRQWNASSLGY